MSGPRLAWERPRTRAAVPQPAAVQTPEHTPNTPHMPYHPDQHLESAIHAAWWSGHDSAERTHYTKGWRAGLRTGVLCGLLVGGTSGMVGMASAGWLATALAGWLA